MKTDSIMASGWSLDAAYVGVEDQKVDERETRESWRKGDMWLGPGYFLNRLARKRLRYNYTLTGSRSPFTALKLPVTSLIPLS